MGKQEEPIEIYSEEYRKGRLGKRYNIRLAIKKGVEVKEGTREDLKDFHKIMVETGKRDDFIIRSLSYFEKLSSKLLASIKNISG